VKLRLITALVALAIVVPILFFGGVHGVQVLCVAAAALGIWEFGALRTPPSSTGNRIFASVLAALPIIAAGLPINGLALGTNSEAFAPVTRSATRADFMLLALGVAFLAIPIARVLNPKDIEKAPSSMTATLYSVLYLGFTLSFCVSLRAMENGLLWIVLGLSVVWLGDTGAYMGGRAFGKHKLHPRISPGKTWEGSVAGILTSIAAGFAAREVFRRTGLWAGPLPGTLDVVVVSVWAGALGQIGDLAESLLKRAVSVKDSGTMFPGHGGMLDRIDALLFALPGVYFYVKFIFTA
jgi:phosphatidate cytidylyltransferase